jgi:hypothetical protein
MRSLIKGITAALAVTVPGLLFASSAVDNLPAAEAQQLRQSIQEMRANPRGPFSQIRWFCNDGSVLPPKAYACVEHGGGNQHGEWSDQTLRLRAAGFPVANVMVQLDAADFGELPPQQDHFRALILEQFLIDYDDGWILHKARYYRGAFQIEDEEASAYAFLSELARQPGWIETRYPLLVEAARLIPHGQSAIGAADIRGMATVLNTEDAGFSELRNKIHGRPEPSDAARVREYAARSGKPELADDYEALAAAIDTAARLPDPAPAIDAFAAKSRDSQLANTLRQQTAALSDAATATQRLERLGTLMATLREGISRSGNPLDCIDLILSLEAHVFNLGQKLGIGETRYSRAESVDLMHGFARAAYGVGLLTAWEWQNLSNSMKAFDAGTMELDGYLAELRYLGRAPGWATRRLALYFEPTIHRFAQIEPLSAEYLPDRMRGSPLLFYSRLLEPLEGDAMQLAGIRQQMFGRDVPSGLRSLNPGIGRGVLRTLDELRNVPEGTADSIALVPETVSELPVVAGILTEHEGNALSHVQLLARNLGVPNVVVADQHLPDLRRYLGQRIMVASSPRGVVRIMLDDSHEDARSDTAPQVSERISIDVSRLDLTTQELIPTSQLGSADQGVRVGPKAAQVGKLTKHFPGHVAPGLAVPFGLFAHSLLDRQVEPGGPTLFEWMTIHFDELQAIDDPVQRTTRTREILGTIRNWFETRPPNPEKLDQFHQALLDNFGPDGSYGVFVRSDTNVEDLPGFTGAGINLTVPNVVGFDNIVQAMRDVWASPFTERSYGWRQGIMNDPEHVYASVLLHRSVNADISGVLVTADAETGARDHITVVVNEGVGGGVEGQAAESLLVRKSDAKVSLLGSATAPYKRILKTSGGSELVSTSGAERLLTEDKIAALLKFVSQLPGWFDTLPPEERADAVADVEFGFVGDKLYLFQIRPFVQSQGASSSSYLRSLDEGLVQSSTVRVNLEQPPGG